ncbi:MAG: HEAT repeat domain-containing protein [Planctomycetota bacterium]
MARIHHSAVRPPLAALGLAASLVPFSGTLAQAPATQPATQPASQPAAEMLDAVAQRDRAEAIVGALLRSDDPAEQDQLDRQLAELGDHAAVALRLATLTGDFQERQRADAAASRLRWRQAAGSNLLTRHETLVVTMARGNPQERGALVDQLAEAADPQALGFFVECLTDGQPYVQRRAVDALVALARNDPAQSNAVAAQFNTLLETGDDETRVLIVGALSQMGSANIDALAGLLDSRSEELRRTAIRAMGHSRNAAAIPHLLPMLSDSRWQVRAATLDALEELASRGSGKNQVGRAVTPLLDDSDAFIRKRAIALIGEIEYTGARPQLHAMLEAGDGDAKALLAALVELKDPRAARLIRPRFEAAETPADRQGWLMLLASSGQDAATDRLIWSLLEDNEQRPLWATAVEAIDRRNKTAERLPLIAGLMLDDDQAIADAAYNALRYERDQTLPPTVVDRLATHATPLRRKWALNLLFGHRDPRLGQQLVAAMADPDAEVTLLAVTMLSAEAGEPMPTVRLPYRRDTRSMDVIQSNGVSGTIESSETQTTASTPAPDWSEAVRAQLDRDPQIALPAAALLYHTQASDDDAVQSMLRRGLETEDNPSLVAIAMWGIKNRPGPFEADLDLVALSQQPATRSAAIQIMAAAPSGKHLPLLKELAQDATLEDTALIRGLVVSGDDDARAQALRLFTADPHNWNASQALEALYHAPGPGPVRFADALLDRGSNGRVHNLPDLILTLPDPSVGPVLLKLAKTDDYWLEPGRLMSRLQEIDPQAAVEMSQQMLFSDDATQVNSAIESLVESTPNDNTLALALRGLTQQSPSTARVTWEPLVAWLPRPFVMASVLPEFESLHPGAARAVTARLQTDAVADDVPALLAAQWSGVQSRERLAQLIASLTASDPAARPDLGVLEPAALALALSAAAEWPDASAAVLPYLEHADPRIAQAAVTALALHAASLPAFDFTDAHLAALLSAAAADEQRVAYLAVEALALHRPEALQSLDPNAITGPAARARAALAGLDTTAGVPLVRLATGTHGQTPLRLAMMLALQRGDRPSSQLGDTFAIFYHHDILQRRLAQQPEPDPAWLTALLEFYDLPEPLKQNTPAMSALVEKARADKNAKLLAALGTQGQVANPNAQDVALLLRNLRRLQHEYDEGWYGDPVSSLLIAWAGVADAEATRSRMKARTLEGVAAAAILAVGHQDAEAIGLLVNLVTRSPSHRQLEHPASIRPRVLALNTLVFLRHRAIVPALVEQATTEDAEDWPRMQYTPHLARAIATLDPAAAAQLPAVSRRSPFSAAMQIDASTVSLMLLDPAHPAADAAGETSVNAPHEPSTLLHRLDAERVIPEKDRDAAAVFLPPWPEAIWLTSDHGGWHYSFNDDYGPTYTALESSGPANHYLGLGLDPAPVESSTDDDPPSTAEQLRKMLLDTNAEPQTRIVAMRTAASLGHRKLIPDLITLLDQHDATPPSLTLEAAWALAWLDGPDATPAIVQAFNNTEAFDPSVELAALLHLLGDDRGSELLDRAAQLTTLRRLRARALSIGDPPKRRSRGGFLGFFGSGPSEEEYLTLEQNMEAGDATPDAGVVPWWRVVGAVRAKQLADTEDRLLFDRWATPIPTAPPLDVPPLDPDHIHITLDGQLNTPAMPGHGIPIPPLMSPTAPLFASAMLSEAASEPAVFVQLAHRANSPTELRDAWRAWWREHQDAGWQRWWWQGILTAEEELTHPHWWHRTRGVARLRRLTGKAWPIPPIFEPNAWANLQQDVTGWRESHQNHDPASVVVTLAIEAGVSLPNGPDTDPLTALAHLATAGDPDQSVAARMILNRWPDKPALLEAARPWQRSDHPDLRHWARDQFTAGSGETRLYY